MDFVRSRVQPGTNLVTDETAHWDLLSRSFYVERVNHSDVYSFLDSVHISGAESYFARLRRMIQGQHHRVSPGYLASYAAHAAWLEDHRRQSNGAFADAWIGQRLRGTGQPPLEGLLATRSIMAGPADQMHMPFRFSTMTTILRRAA